MYLEDLKNEENGLGDYTREKIFLTNDGRAIHTDYDEENKEYRFEEVCQSYILFNLHEPIVLESDFTLRSYFKLVENYPNFQLIDYFFGCFLEEYRNCSESGCIDPDKEVDYLCLNRVMAYEAPRTIDPEAISFLDGEEEIEVGESIEYFIDFHGMSEDEKNSYALEFSPLNQLLDHKIILGNAKISIELPGSIEEYEKFEDKYFTRETEDNNYTLYEFVKEIIWELSFCGCPENRDVKWREIKGRSEKVKEELENGYTE